MSLSQPEGYLAVPSTGAGPGLLVLHAWWGLNENIKTLCNRLASEGFIAFAPDLYDGKVATTIADAKTLCNALDEARSTSIIAEALTYFNERSDVSVRGVGVMGFSLGVYFALNLADHNPESVRAVVLFYGSGGESHSKSNAAYLGHMAENDDYEPAAEIKKLEEALRAAGRPVTFHTYPGTGHWFFEPDRPDAYDESAATLAWERTVPFLKEQLSP